MPGNEFDRRRWRKKGESVGVAVKIACRSKAKSNFGHRKRDAKHESPSAPDKHKSLETIMFQGFFLYT